MSSDNTIPSLYEQKQIADFLYAEARKFSKSEHCSKPLSKENLSFLKSLLLAYKQITSANSFINEHTLKSYKKNRTTLLRTIRDIINPFLAELCMHKKICPAIQFFNHYLDSYSNRKQIGSFILACAKKSDSKSTTAEKFENFEKAKLGIEADWLNTASELKSGIINEWVYFREPKSDDKPNDNLEIYSMGTKKYYDDYQHHKDTLGGDWLCLIWVTEGKFSGKMNQQNCSLGPGQIAIVFPKSVLLDAKTQQVSTMWWVCFDGEVVQNLISKYNLKEGIFDTDIDPEKYLTPWLEKLNKHQGNSKMMDKLKIEYANRGRQLLHDIGSFINK